MSESYDLIINNGWVIDGTGSPAYRADVAVKGDRIARIAPAIEAEADRIIDASGLRVSPGFIDTHSHDDGFVLARPACDPKILQGVTTEVIGNCGSTLAPLPSDPKTYLAKVAMIMGGGIMPEELYRVRTFADYLDILDKTELGVNVAPLVGHTAIRIAAMSWENRPPTADELTEMRRLTAESMEAGAIGFSSGLIYVPAIFARTEELTALAEVVGRYHGLYATHMRSEGDQQMAAIEEALAVGRGGGVPVHVSHHKIAGKVNWGMSQKTLTRFETARAEGLEVTCDQYPYRAGSTHLSACLPPDFASGGPDVWAPKLADPAVRQRVGYDIDNGIGFPGDNLMKGAGFENVFISFTKQFPAYEGRSIAEIAATEGRLGYDVFFDLVAAEKTNVGMIVFMMDEADIVRIMTHPLTMIGSDGIPSVDGAKIHPRMTGTFPRILGRFVREKKALSLPEAIRKMTCFPANTFRLKGRGLVKEGFYADLVLFDPETVTDMSDYKNPERTPVGIPYVVVNGRVSVDKGKVIGAGAGRVLRRN